MIRVSVQLGSWAVASALVMACGSTERGPSGTDAGADTGWGGSGYSTGAVAGRSGGSAGESGGAGGSLPPPPMDGGTPDPECQREVSLEAVTLGEPLPFDLIIVADHSDSLAWSRDELSRGLDELLTRVEGRSVRIFVLTPTQYGASSAAAIRPLQNEPVVPWRDPDTGEPYENAMTSYSQVCTNPDGATIDCPSPLGPDPYRVQGQWTFEMPDPIAELKPDMTDAEFAVQRDTVSEAILAIGGSGSPLEQPLCTLGRYISQDPSRLPEHAVFLLISDEDDVSTPDECVVSFTGEVRSSRNENGTSPCSSDCDAYRFSMTGDSLSKGYDITCAAFDDRQELIEGSEEPHHASQSGLTSCDEVQPGPCSDADRQSLEWVCETGKVITSCSVECSVYSGAQCKVDLPEAGVDACTDSFSHQGRTWQNLAEYCATRGTGFRDCTGGGVYIQYSESLGGSSSTQGLTPGSTAADLGRYFRTTAHTRFAPEAYLVEAIVFEPAFSCSLGSGQSYATNLVEFVNDPSRVFPLCESYAPALDGIFDFAQALIQTSFSLELEDDEDVTAVIVVDRAGVERALAAGDYDYDRSTKVLTVARNAIHATDATLRVEVTSDCRPIVR